MLKQPHKKAQVPQQNSNPRRTNHTANQQAPLLGQSPLSQATMPTIQEQMFHLMQQMQNMQQTQNNFQAWGNAPNWQ